MQVRLFEFIENENFKSLFFFLNDFRQTHNNDDDEYLERNFC